MAATGMTAAIRTLAKVVKRVLAVVMALGLSRLVARASALGVRGLCQGPGTEVVTGVTQAWPWARRTIFRKCEQRGRDRGNACRVSWAMTSPDEKLTLLVAELRKAVIGAELKRGRAER